MATPKEAHVLTSHFKKLWKEKYGTNPVINSHAVRWAFDNMLRDMGPVEAKALIDYYFETISTNQHSLDWFLYNYDKLQVAKTERDKDAASLARIRQESKRRAEEWRKRIGNNRVEGS
jgi:hypothetical protein